MSVRLAHVHEDGKACYVTRSHRKLTHQALLDDTTAVAFMGYTGSWYAYDTATGKEVATFSRQFFEEHIRPRLIADLVPDPDCTP